LQEELFSSFEIANIMPEYEKYLNLKQVGGLIQEINCLQRICIYQGIT